MTARPVVRALLGDGLARLCTALLAAVILLAVAGPLLSPWSAEDIDWAALEAPPSAGHWFGTDPQFWLNLQAQFELVQADRETGATIRHLPTKDALPPRDAQPRLV